MNYLNSSASYFDWNWILWMGFLVLVFSSFGNWGYTYRAHRRFDVPPSKDAQAILNERYAAGEVTRAQYLEFKSDISA